MKEDRKKQKRGIFISLTRKQAKKEILERQNKLQRKLTPEERKNIIEKVAARAKVRTALVALIGAGAIGGASYAIKALPEANEAQIESQNKADSFRETIKVEIEEKTEIETAIDDLETKEDVLAYLKNIYVEEYEKSTGDESLQTKDISITKTPQNYVYKLDDDSIVTHGNAPGVTEQEILKDDKKYEYENSVDLYSVSLEKDGKIIDAIAKVDNKLQKAIPGDEYKEMKDYNSILAGMGDITKESFDLMKVMEEVEKEPDNEFIQNKYKNAKKSLVEAVTQYEKENVKTSKVTEQDDLEL